MSQGRVDPLTQRLRTDVGKCGPPTTARDPVNVATIRNWCDAIAEANPRFTSGEFAPPAMLNVWPMAGLMMGKAAPRDPDMPQANVYAMLDEAGFTGVVATNSDLHFDRYLRPGDLITTTTRLTEVSEQKRTRLGVGHFVTTEAEYQDQHGVRVGLMRFRILKYAKPSDGDGGGDGGGGNNAGAKEADDSVNGHSAAPRPTRPRPRFNQDQAWFWEGLRARELRIQRFSDDSSLRHPPANANPNTGHFDYDWITASGAGKLYSYTVVHHPQVPSFDYPNIVGLVELEEGVRVVSNLVGLTPEQVEIGMDLQLCFVDTDDDLTLHQFRPAAPARNTTGLQSGQVAVGDQLPLLPIPIDPLLIVSTAIATRDFQEVHHDRDVAQARGSRDIFMNILTTTGLVARWIGDWAGDHVTFHNIKIGLGAPNYPHDLMTLSGSVTEQVDESKMRIGFVGRNSIGAHVTGTADVSFSQAEPGP